MDLSILPGYAEILSEVKAAWQDVQDSQSLRIVLIEGESGSHKTDIVKRFLDETKAPCVFAQGYRIPESYFPLRMAFESWMELEEVQKHLKQLPDQVARDWQSALTLFAQLLPVLRLTDTKTREQLARWQPSTLQGATDSGFPGAEGSSYPMTIMTLPRLFTIALGELARLMPIVFFLDNLDLIDTATLEAFCTDILPSWKNIPILFVATFASISGEELAALSKFIETARNMQHARHMELVNIAEGDIHLVLGEQISNLAADKLAVLVHHVYRATRGNLAQIQDVVEWIQSEGAQVFANPESIPSHVRLCQRRFDQLGELERKVLQIGAVQGISFCSKVVADVACCVLDGNSQEEIDRLLNDLAGKSRSFIRSGKVEVVRGGNWYEFLGRRIHAWVYESISEETRKWYHREIGHALENVYKEDVIITSLLADHFKKGNLAKESAHYFAKVARQSNEWGDSQLAGKYAQEGLRLLESAEDVLEVCCIRCQLFLEKGRALKNVRPYEAVEALEESSRIAFSVLEVTEASEEIDGMREEFESCELEASLHLGETWLILNDWEQGFKRLSETIDLAIEQGKDTVVIGAMEMLRDQYYRRGETEKYFELCDEKVKVLQSISIFPDKRVIIAEILEDKGWMYLGQGKSNRALRTFWQAQGFLEYLSNPEKYPEIHYKIYMGKADVLHRSRDVARALQEAEEAIKWADVSQQRRYQALARVARATILSHAGETRTSEKEYQDLLDRYENSADWVTVVYLKEKYGDFLILTGKLSEAKNLLQPLYEDLTAMGNLLWAQRIRVQLAKLDSYMGKFHRSLTVFQQLLGEATARNDKVGQIALLNHLGDIYRLQNRAGEAEQAHLRAIYICQEIQSTRLVDSLHHLGRVHLTNWTHIEQAEEKLTEAEERLVTSDSLDARLDEAAEEKKEEPALPYEERTGYIKDYNHLRLSKGRLFLCQNRLDDSLKMLRKATSAALKVNDRLSSGLGYLNVGLVYLCQGKPEEALKMTEYALDELPTESWRKAEGHHLLARCYLAMGELEKAREHADTAKTRFINLGLFHRVNQVESTELYITEAGKTGNVEKWRCLDEMELRFDFNHLGI